MYEYIKGNIAQLTPTFVIVEAGNIGYLLNISLNTFPKLKEGEVVKLFIHQVIKEDAHDFYGFIDEHERHIFRSLISVSGVGSNTARMILSSLSPIEIVTAITSGDVKTLKAIKGIGEKSAQRMIIDLKDKLGKAGEMPDIFSHKDNTTKQEALSALLMLGFGKAAIEKILEKVVSETPTATVEQLVKLSLKRL
jgi:holliday junction DNA helicase RuvA